MWRADPTVCAFSTGQPSCKRPRKTCAALDTLTEHGEGELRRRRKEHAAATGLGSHDVRVCVWAKPLP